MRLKGSAREKRNRLFIQLSLGVTAVTVIGVLAAVILTGLQPAGPGPLNMQSDGIKIGGGNVAVKTPALEADASPVASPANANNVVEIALWVDYLCPICGQFEEANSAVIADLLERGAATIEIHPIAILTNRSQGTQYSLRAANAAGCVANNYPNSFLDFHNALYANQPDEGTEGLTDDELIALATGAGAGPEVESCINDGTFKDWVKSSTERAISGDIAINNLDKKFTSVTGTPTVLINGKQFNPSYDRAAALPFSSEEFLRAVVTAAGAQ
ncbi:MAG: DsbA family protein [Microbacteriaceae bacterium]|nr:DsbA family protein [Microbacteriaceae bacterium]